MRLNNLEHYNEFFICAYCAYCVNNNAACPTFLSVRHEIVTGRGKIITARNLAQGMLNKEEGLAALTELKLLSLTNITVSFKDPCELGRYCGEYDIACELISSLPGIDNVDLANNRENTLCCGAGGLVKANYPDLAEDIALRLIQQMEKAGTELCLSACPSCLLNIDQFLQQQSSILAIDIAQLVHRFSQNYQNSLIMNQ